MAQHYIIARYIVIILNGIDTHVKYPIFINIEFQTHRPLIEHPLSAFDGYWNCTQSAGPFWSMYTIKCSQKPWFVLIWNQHVIWHLWQERVNFVNCTAGGTYMYVYILTSNNEVQYNLIRSRGYYPIILSFVCRCNTGRSDQSSSIWNYRILHHHHYQDIIVNCIRVKLCTNT